MPAASRAAAFWFRAWKMLILLIPGMPVQAFIETEERTPMAYLLKPFTDYFRLAFRES